MNSPLFDCAPILLPGPGEPYSRLVIWISGVMYLAIKPYASAYQYVHALDHFARELGQIPHCHHEGKDFVPAWWLIDAFPYAAQKIDSICVEAINKRAERKSQRRHQQ